MNKLVSIITPCYNGETYIQRFLESIYNQSYPNIELIIVNDGSTDNTESFILSYKEKFEAKGYGFHYIKQVNSGQSAAINKALEIFSGDYLTWPDSDDYLPIHSISTKVNFLENNPQAGLVICKTQVVEDITFKPIRIQERIRPKGKDNLFYDLIKGENVYYSPGGYMVRSHMFKDAMPKPLKIEAPREIGQNFQLLLPIAFKYPCGYINDIGYLYTIRPGSHSRSKHSYETKLHALNVGERVLTNINRNLDTTEAEHIYIQKLIRQRTLTFTLKMMLHHNRKDNINAIVNELKEITIIDKNYRRLILSVKYPLIKRFYSIISVFYQFSRKIFR